MAGNCFSADVGGIVSVDTVWRAADGPYSVGETVVIANGATLSIEAGATIYMAAEASLIVDAGGLLVNGSPAAPVRITSWKLQSAQPGAPGDWGQIRFNQGTISAKTRLDNVVVEFGRGIVMSGASPTLNNVEIKSHDAPAISIDLASSPQGSGSSAVGNALNGVLVPAGELTGNVHWGLRGIPFVLSQGSLEVGRSPKLSGANPTAFEQGEQASVSLSGVRLSGFDKLRFDPPIPGASILSGATDTSVGVSIRVPDNMPAGPVAASAQTYAGEVVLPNAFTISPMQVPVITSVTPRTAARNVETTILITGSSLSAATVSSSTPGLRISGVSTSRNMLSLRVSVDPELVPAVYPLQVANAAGQATFSLEVIPDVAPPPPFSLIPTLVTLAPDSIYRTVLFSAAQSATQDRSYSLAIGDPTVARLRSTSVVLPAGQVSAPIAVAGLKLGSTALQVSGDGLATPLEAPVSVVAGGYKQTSVAPAVGIVRGEQFTGGANNRVLISKPVGMVIGNGNTTNVASYKVVGSPVGLVKGNLYGGESFVVSPVVRLLKQ